MRLIKVATCNLNQWAMDFKGNLERVQLSILQAKQEGAVFRVGPELEIPGYGCEDHFHEHDTLQHSWECLQELLLSDATDGIVCDIGMPVEFCGTRYNCRVVCLDRRVLLVRPKMDLANDGNYRESRWFASWRHRGELRELRLPPAVAGVVGQETAPFGDGVLEFADTVIASETCEELFTPSAANISLALNGVEIVANGSGSHHELRKLNRRFQLIQGATAKAGGVYLYANQKGCDGGRLYFDGCASVVLNADVVAQGSQFSLADVEVVTAVLDLDMVSSYRGSISSLREQASAAQLLPRVRVEKRLCRDKISCGEEQEEGKGTGAWHMAPLLQPFAVRLHAPEEEIALGPACWLWDYLRRSGASGFLLPLSGGADSSAVAAIVGSMCQMAVKAIAAGDETVTADVIRIGRYKPGEVPTGAAELAGRLLHTVYMGSENSSSATRSRAKLLAAQIGASHLDVRIDSVIAAIVALFVAVTGKTPRFKVDSGSSAENLALQNIQARTRMLLAFLFAQLLPWVRQGTAGGFLLVLGSANVDEALRGYLTKYDCSSADINPIGGISKRDLKSFLKWAAVHLGYPSLAEVEAAPPTAELEPIRENHTQVDEVDMGMSYDELSLYGRLRKVFHCGPVSMFQHLCQHWALVPPVETAEKVKKFFTFYSMNRHKLTTLTPSYHAENYSPEDNRFDLRQFLYNTKWPWQFQQIDRLVENMEGHS